MSSEQVSGFDVAWPETEESFEEFAWDVSDKLVTKGYCVVQTLLSDSILSQACGEVSQQTGWKRFVEELELAYLGRNAQGKAAWLETDMPDQEVERGLAACDRLLTEAWYALEPVSQAMFGFGTIGRTDGLLRVAFDGSSDEQAVLQDRGKLDDIEVHVKGRIEEHLKFIQQRRIGCFLALDGAGSSLTLHPREGGDVALPLEKGALVIFRHDRLSFTYVPASQNAVALQAWILAEGQGTMLQEYDGPLDQYDEALGLVSGPPAPIYGYTGCSVSLMAMDCMLAMNALGPEWYWQALVAGTDGGRHLSPIRWDPDMYFVADKDLAFGRYYSNHGGFVLEDACLGFDHAFFGLTEDQVYNIDPCQRNCMEVGYNVMHKAGWTRSSLNGAHVGVYVGNCGTDWASARLNPMVNPIDPDYHNGFSANMLNCRLSFIFGMRGPLSTSDTACSSSLVATASSHNALRRVEPDQMRISNNAFIKEALVLGTNGLWGPLSWIGLCGPRMLSQNGRCFTFDHSADGFARGEGSSGIMMRVTDKEPSGRLAMICGSCINQDGRSASMTAPHGPSQQECLKASMREANIVPGDVRVAELHGTGTALGDPIEVGALRGVMKNRTFPIIKTSAKSNLEHGEGNAGMAGLIKCFILLMHGTCPPNIHLADLNPHIDIVSYPVLFSDDSTELGACSGYAGVSSFGFGGTNARADLWAKSTVGIRKTGKLDDNKLDYITVRCAKCMGWMDHVGSLMMPTAPPKPPAGRFKACCIRDELASYDYCSACYTGGYLYGTPPQETPMPKGNLYITGTWDGWSSHKQVDLAPDGVYHFFTRLGETRMERFYFTLEQNANFAIFPAAKNAGMEIRTEGPKKLEEGHAWLIDGRDDEWAEGTLLHITLAPDKDTGLRKVVWEVIPEENGPAERPPFQHSYFVIGSWTAEQMAKMTPVPGKRHAFEYTTRIGVTGQESFQLARDCDWEQLIYPAVAGTQRPGAPIRGPDGLGRSRKWYVFGEQNETMTVRLEVSDGLITVSAGCASSGLRRWESVVGRGRKRYTVSGTWINGCVPMTPDPERPDVFRLRMEMGAEAEEFQVLVDEDPNSAFYPEVKGFPCGSVFVYGPDHNSMGSTFLIEGEVGAFFEITLDLRSEDKRWVVAWRPVNSDGSPLLPWSPDVKYGICDVPGR